MLEKQNLWVASMDKDRNKRQSADISLLFNEVDFFVHEMLPLREKYKASDNAREPQILSQLDPDFFSPSRIDKQAFERRRTMRAI